MNSKYIILSIVGVLVLFFVLKSDQVSASKDFTVCQDYEFMVNLNTAPTTIDFYIGGELFKTVPSNDKFVKTLLHCGHVYSITYKSTGYQEYKEDFIVGKAMPINPETRDINLVPVGAN